VPAGSNAAELVAALGFAGRPLAVEVNEEVVPRARLADCRLDDGDRLELVTLVGGG
jgi:sulfur carrier protein